jgi:beta-glucosidase
MAWLPGERGGGAIAGALVGEFSPGGRLPVNYPRHSGQIPTYYAHKVSGGRSHWKGEYVDMSNEPLYRFGHGLGYSEFEIVVETVAGDVVTVDDSVRVSASVTNRGDRVADEVVQLYTRDPVASITRPVLELQGFARLTLDPGASAGVVFDVPVAALGFTGRDMTYVVEPGDIELFVGRSSADLLSAGYVTVAGDKPVTVRRLVAGDATVTVN